MAFGKKRRKGVARKKNRPPRIITKTRWRARREGPKRRGGKRRGGRRKGSSAKVAAAVGTVLGAAVVGGLANEAGLLYGMPVQNKTGVSLVGWTGLGLVTIGLLFAKKESTKLLTYGVGGGLCTTEIVRQIDMRGYDFEVAFGNAPAITSDPTPPQLPTNEVEKDKVRNSITIENV